MRSPTLASMMLLVCSGTCLSAQAAAPRDSAQPRDSFRGEFDPVAALVVLYGRPPWNDVLSASRSTFENGSDYIEPLYDAAFVEGGVQKHVVIATLTPRPRSQYNCHACSPMLGGAVFRRDGEVWRIESKGLKIEAGHAWFDGEHGRLALVRIGQDRFGLLHEIHDVGQGHESMRASLIFGMDGALASRLAVPPVEGPGPGACALPAQQMKVDMPGAGTAGPATTGGPDSASGFYDVVVDAHWNDAQCVPVDGGARSSGRSCQRTTRYRYRDGAYVQAAIEAESCTDVPERTVDFRG